MPARGGHPPPQSGDFPRLNDLQEIVPGLASFFTIHYSLTVSFAKSVYRMRGSSRAFGGPQPEVQNLVNQWTEEIPCTISSQQYPRSCPPLPARKRPNSSCDGSTSSRAFSGSACCISSTWSTSPS